MPQKSTLSFKGSNFYTAPGNLVDGELTACDNLYIDYATQYQTVVGGYGVKGGDLVSRLGILGQFAAGQRLSHPLISPLAFLLASGDTNLLFASGSLTSTSGGKLYSWDKNTGGAPTEVKLAGTTSFSLNTNGVRIVRLGGYAYLIDGMGNLIRTDTTGVNTNAVIGMAPETVAPGAALTSGSELQGFDPNTASYDAPSTTNVFPLSLAKAPGWATTNGWTSVNADYRGAGSGLPVNNDAGFNAPSFYQPYCWRQFNGTLGAAQPKSTTSPVILNAQHSDGSGDYAGQFLVSFLFYQGNGYAGLTIEVQAFSDTGGSVLIGNQSLTICPQCPLSPTTFQQCNILFDLSALGTAIKSWKISFTGAQPVGGGQIDNGIQIGAISGFPTWGILANGYGGFVAGGFGSGYWFSTPSPVPAAGQTASITGAMPGVPPGINNNPYNGYTGTGITDVLFPSPTYNCFTKDARFTVTFGSNQNFSGYSGITVPLSGFAASTAANGIAFTSSTASLAIRILPSTGAPYLEVPLTIAPDGSYAYGDISVLTTSVLGSVAAMQLIFLANPIILSAPFQFNFGPLTIAGNLSVGPQGQSLNYAPVFYIVTEINDDGDETVVNIIESDGGVASNQIQATPQFATGIITLPAQAPVNGASTTHYCFYRFGGIFVDGYGRIVATVPVGSDIVAPFVYTDLLINVITTQITSPSRPFEAGDVGQTLDITGGIGSIPGLYTIVSVLGGVATLNSSAGAAYSVVQGTFGGDTLARDQLNPYVLWNHIDKTLIDNTPDSFLFNAGVFELGREQPPTAAQAIAAWQSRLCLGVDSTLYISWLINAGLDNGMYFTTADLPNDPDLVIKGATFSIGGSDNDPVQALLPYGPSLLVLKQLSTWIVQGTDPTSFTCQQLFCQGQTVGCVAPKTACIVGGIEAWWLGADGVYGFDGSSITKRSQVLQPVLNPRGQFGEATISSAAYANCAMFEWNKVTYLLAPVGGGSTNTIAYPLNTVTGTWARYTNFAFTSGVALTSQTDTNDCFLCGYDGQIYIQSGTADYAYPTAAATPITVSMQSRGYGQENAVPTAFNKTRPTRYRIQGTLFGAAASTVLTVGVRGDSLAGAYSKGHAFTVPANSISPILGVPGADFEFKSKLPPSCAGTLCYLTFSAPLTTAMRIHAIGIDFSSGSIESV